jgi:hypothetical protein
VGGFTARCRPQKFTQVHTVLAYARRLRCGLRVAVGRRVSTVSKSDWGYRRIEACRTGQSRSGSCCQRTLVGTAVAFRHGLVFQALKGDRSKVRFWSAVIRLLLILGVLVIFALSALNWAAPTTSIASLHSLDGCYEGEGLPDFMRPPRHWTFIIVNGVIVDRDGHDIAKIRLRSSTQNTTPVAFSPGILIAGKPSTVLRGDTVAGKAYVKGGLVIIVLADDWGNVMQKTSCN